MASTGPLDCCFRRAQRYQIPRRTPANCNDSAVTQGSRAPLCEASSQPRPLLSGFLHLGREQLRDRLVGRARGLGTRSNSCN
jgi:hypothetical protein